jgi:hypothetical protein
LHQHKSNGPGRVALPARCAIPEDPALENRQIASFSSFDARKATFFDALI